MTLPVALNAIPPWQQAQPVPPPATPAIQPVAAAPETGDSSSDSRDAGRSNGGAIYVPQRQYASSPVYAKPAPAQGNVNPEPESGTASADIATVKAALPTAPAKADPPLLAAANAAYAMVADAPGTMPASVLHPLRGG